jgi:hypothetical protein
MTASGLRASGVSDKARKVRVSYMASRDKISAWPRISIQAVLACKRGRAVKFLSATNRINPHFISHLQPIMV